MNTITTVRIHHFAHVKARYDLDTDTIIVLTEPDHGDGWYTVVMVGDDGKMSNPMGLSFQLEKCGDVVRLHNQDGKFFDEKE